MANIRKFEEAVAFQLRLEKELNEKVIRIAERKRASKNDLLVRIIEDNINDYDTDAKI